MDKRAILNQLKRNCFRFGFIEHVNRHWRISVWCQRIGQIAVTQCGLIAVQKTPNRWSPKHFPCVEQLKAWSYMSREETQNLNQTNLWTRVETGFDIFGKSKDQRYLCRSWPIMDKCSRCEFWKGFAAECGWLWAVVGLPDNCPISFQRNASSRHKSGAFMSAV